MVAWVDETQLAAYADRAAAWGRAVEEIRGQALAALASIERWAERAAVDRELAAVAERAAALARDHRARHGIAVDLLSARWGGISRGLSAWDAGPALNTGGDRLIEELESQLAALASVPGFTGTRQAIAELQRQLRKARIARMRRLIGQYDGLRSVLSLEIVREAIREGIVDQALALGLDPGGFMAAARAMMEGISPEEAGLDPLLFPDAYVAAHAERDRLLVDRDTIEQAMWAAWDRANVALLEGDLEAERAAWEEVRHLDEVVDQIEDRLAGRADLALTLGAATGYLDDLVLVDASNQDHMVGEFLAQNLMDRFGEAGALQEIGTVLNQRVNTSRKAVAFYNTLPGEMLPVLPWLAYRDSYGTIEAMAPFAQTLAMASYSEALAVRGAEVIGEFSEPNAATWFVGANYEPEFLREAAVALVAVSGGNVYMPWTTEVIYGPGGAETSYDARVVLASQISLDGSESAAAFLAALEAVGLLEVFVRPETLYGDGGGAAGSILALLGTRFDVRSAELMAEVMGAIADRGADPGVLIGAAAMISPHLTSFLDPRLARDLEQTELAPVIADRSEATAVFLAEVLADPDAAQLVFASLEFLLLAEIDQHFDPNDSESLAGVSRQFGLLADELSQIYLDTELASAEARDRINDLVNTILSLAADVALAGVLLVAGPEALALAILAEVGAAGATSLLLPAVLDNVLPTDNVEGVLAAGYALENRFVDAAELYTLIKLHEAGLLELPSEWFVDGRLQLPSYDDLREYEARVTQDFPYADWINDPISIGGTIRWDPSSD